MSAELADENQPI